MAEWLKNMVKRYLRLEDSTAYQIASALADYVWKVVARWDWFGKRTLGAQFVESVDSIAGNIAEGWGRFHKKDKQKFYYNARGSVYESAHWAKKARERKLLTPEESDRILNELRKLPKELNSLIRITEVKLKK